MKRQRKNRDWAAAPSAANLSVFVQLDEDAQKIYSRQKPRVSFPTIVAVAATMVKEGLLSGTPVPEDGKLLVRLSADDIRAVLARVRASRPVTAAAVRAAIEAARGFIARARAMNPGVSFASAEEKLAEAVEKLRDLLGATGSPEKEGAATQAARAALEAAEAALEAAKKEVVNHLLTRASALAKRAGIPTPPLNDNPDEDRRVLVDFLRSCELILAASVRGDRDGRLPAAPAYPHVWGKRRGGGRR